MTSLTMERLCLVYLCIVIGSGLTSAGETGPDVVHLTVREGDDVVLTCSFGSSNIQTQLFDWKKDGQKEVFLYDNTVVYGDQRYGQDPHFKGRVSHYPGELVSGNASIRIRDTKVKDSGNYTCDFPRHQPIRRSRVSLVVGAAPKPSVTILNHTKDWSLLQCEVLGASPKPEVEWRNSAGNVLPAEQPKVTQREGRYDIILVATVTKTDHYRCVAIQEEIHHQRHAKIYVYINDADQQRVSDSSTREVVVGVVVGVVAVIVTLLVVAVVVYLKRRNKNAKKGSQTERETL